jgi:ferrous-iron efflux pump FieF
MPDRSTRLNLSATIASVAVAVVLVLLKLWALGQTGALSVAASLADSALDLMISLAGLAAVAYAARPPDEDHAFGHSSVEDLAALGQSAFILASSVVIAAAAVRRLAGSAPPLHAETSGIAVMVVSIAMTVALVIWQRRVARQTRSRVVAADSLHYMADLVPNLGAIVSLFASARLGLPQIDSVVAIAAAAMLAIGALRIGVGAWHALMDRAADPKMVAGIEELARTEPGLQGFHDLKTRTAGARVFVNIHVEIDGDLPLRQAHAVGASLRHRIIARYPEADVIVHHDPV